ncbi:MAG: DNA-processing protein DprA [Pseudomonadota bacterium]
MNFSSSHPPLPPISEEECLVRLRLLRSRRVGPATFHKLIRDHGSARAALEALPEIAQRAGERGYEVCAPGVAEAEMRAARKARARPLWIGEAGYPALLSEVPDAPPLLWARGPLSPDGGRTLGIVGARNASSLGTRMTRRLVGELGRAGFVIVSGLARGIDTMAHHTAVETGTIAAVAGGVDVVYPSENTRLADEIASKGLIVSEMPMGATPHARHFPRRNRIIAGLSRAVVVIEAAAKSGTLITADLAGDYGRDVLAVPGHPFDARAAGCNALIRDGATLVRSAVDVMEALGEEARVHTPAQESLFAGPVPGAEPPQKRRRLREIAALHQEVLDRLGPSPLAEDQLIRGFDVPPAKVTSALVELEMDGQIERQRGGMVCLKTA